MLATDENSGGILSAYTGSTWKDKDLEEIQHPDDSAVQSSYTISSLLK